MLFARQLKRPKLNQAVVERLMFRSRRTIANAIALAVTMLILYALTAGPLVYMERIGKPVLSVEAFLWIYQPLNYAEAKIKPVGRTMQFYIDFWERAAKRHLAAQAVKTAESNGSPP